MAEAGKKRIAKIYALGSDHMRLLKPIQIEKAYGEVWLLGDKRYPPLEIVSRGNIKETIGRVIEQHEQER